MTFMLTDMQHRHEVQAVRVPHLLKGLCQNVGTSLAIISNRMRGV
jgi:hypothetical protein